LFGLPVFFAVSWEEYDKRHGEAFLGPKDLAVGVATNMGALIHHLSQEFQKWICRSDGVDLLSLNGNPEGPVVVLPVGRGVLFEAVCKSLSAVLAFHYTNVEGIGLQNRMDPRCFALDFFCGQVASFGLFDEVTVHILIPIHSFGRIVKRMLQEIINKFWTY